jgi:hypothetical protein
MEEELSRFVIRELGQHVGRSELIFQITERSGMAWPEAEAFVRRIEGQHKKSITKRQSPILIVVGIGTVLAGIGLFFYNFPYLWAYVQDPASAAVYAPYLVRRIVIQVISLGMVLGGALGTWQVINPSSEVFSPEDLKGTGKERYKSMDDMFDVGVYIGDGSGRRSRRRRRYRLW